MQLSKFLLALISLITPFLINAQTINVGDIQLQSEEVGVTYPHRYDLNDNECALIIVTIEQQGLHFSGNIMGNVEDANDKYLIYVPAMTKRISFQHEDFLPGVIDFSDRGIKIAGGKIYMVKLLAETKGNEPPIVKKQYLIFQLQQQGATVMVNGEKWEVINGVAKRKVPLGKYNYSVSLDGYKDYVGNVDMKNEMSKEIVKVSLKSDDDN